MGYKEELKELKRIRKEKIKAIFKNPFQIGDILEHSWGWEQTNIDFYQVVGVTEKSIVLKPIHSKMLLSTNGGMCNTVIPDKDNFKDNVGAIVETYNEKISEVTKKVCALFKDDAMTKISYFVNVPYGWCDKWDGNPTQETHYA